METAEGLVLAGKIRDNITRAIIGKAEAVDLMLICLLCGGHALIEDVPGLGKTTMVSALARSIDCGFQRVQFTPDVLPSDITGFSMYHMATGEKEFVKGAVMTNIILADEINRTSPKTQSALLQAMQEGNVTVDGTTYELPKPFMVCATQNPVDMTGTYPLPEAQLDRFLIRIKMGYPGRNDEISILESNIAAKKDNIAAVVSSDDVLSLQSALDNIKCSRPVMAYITDIAAGTRQHKDVTLGISPRGSIALMRASMGYAMLSGRSFVIPDDAQKMAGPVLSHRLVLSSQAYIQNQTPDSLIGEIVRFTPVPSVS